MMGDDGRYLSAASRAKAAELGCPYGCLDDRGAPITCTWTHVQFACTGDEIVRARVEWVAALRAASAGITAAASRDGQEARHLQLEELSGAACGSPAEAVALEARAVAGSSTERRLRRGVGGLVDSMGTGGAEGLAASHRMVALGLRLQLLARLKNVDNETEIRWYAAAHSKWAEYVRRMRRRVLLGGPMRAAWRRGAILEDMEAVPRALQAEYPASA